MGVNHISCQLLNTSVSRYNFYKHVLFVLLIPSELKLPSVISLKQGNQSKTHTGAFQKIAIEKGGSSRHLVFFPFKKSFQAEEKHVTKSIMIAHQRFSSVPVPIQVTILGKDFFETLKKSLNQSKNRLIRSYNRKLPFSK